MSRRLYCCCTAEHLCAWCEDRIAAAEDARSGRTTTRDEDRLADFAADEHFLGRD